MKELRYQQKAVKELVEKTLDLLSLKGNRHKLVFKAPTGSGKTVMACDMLSQLNTELTESADVPFSQVAYIWIAPNKLHEQSYFKMKNYFTETRDLNPVRYEEIDHSATGYIKEGEIFFVNWESINRDNAVITRETELSASLYDITRRTQEEQGIPIIVIIDEEHMFAVKIQNETEKVLKKINPKIELRISATPETKSDNQVTVPRQKVIEEEMIKKNIIINPAVSFEANDVPLNQQLTLLALKKREELKEAYIRLNVDINPLLLIQLPNDKDKRMDSEDNTIRTEVESFLREQEITEENNKLAVWLSGVQINLDEIEKPNSMVDVLLFKQAIALGWDCPRAAILLIFRKNKSFKFTVQTVGRIMRMPEQYYYEKDILNKGYVYTNLSRDIIEIIKDDMDYISKTALYAERRPNLNNIKLPSEYFERKSSDRNRIMYDFKLLLAKKFVELWGVKYLDTYSFTLRDNKLSMEELNIEQMNILHNDNREIVKDRIHLAVKYIGTDIIKDLEIEGEIGESIVNSKATYINTLQELSLIYNTFCARLIGARFEKLSITSLAFAVKEVLYALFGLNETEAVKVVLFNKNRPKFEEVIRKALDEYLELRKTQKRSKEEKLKVYEWEVPSTRIYNETTHSVVANIDKHALLPFIELNNAYTPEKNFTAFLEKNKEHIDWWYKNGDEGKQHFSIKYVNIKGEDALFYVDYIIRMNNGNVYLFDTKTKESDENAPAKHNALIDYMNRPDNKDKKLRGGILIQEGENWLYSQSKIENTSDLSQWRGFFPDQANKE